MPSRDGARYPAAMSCRFRCAIHLSAALLGVAPAAQAAQVVMAKDGSPAALKAALAAVGGGGVVLVPAGQFAFDDTVTLPSGDITLLGAGSNRTRFYRAKDAVDPKLAAAPYFKASNANGLRFAGFELRGVAVAGSSAEERGIVLVDCHDFRVDHLQLDFLGFAGVYTAGTSRGVVDHCLVHDGFKPAVANYGYGVCVMGTGAYTNDPFGTNEAIFIEDNEVFGARHAAASNNAARYVFRYNHVTANENSHGVDAHGDEYNSTDTGTEWIDVYRNTIDMPIYSGAAVRIRGGKGLVWENTINDYSNAVSLWHKTPQVTGPVHVWSNKLGAGVTAVGDLQGTVSYKLTPPAGYTPYAYPHPLVTDLEADAGPDMVVAADAMGMGTVYVDGSASKADAGTVDAFAWRDGEAPVMSNCARDIVHLPVGEHVVLLEAKRTDGHTEYDTAFVRVLAQGPLASATTWSERWFVPLVGKGTISFTVTPSANAQDAYIAFTGRHAVAEHADAALIVRTNTSGFFDARDGDAYASLSKIPYEAGKSYKATVTLDVAAQTYDVTIDGKTLAKGYAFRRTESSIGQASAWHSKGGLAVDGLAWKGALAAPDPACASVQMPTTGAGGADPGVGGAEPTGGGHGGASGAVGGAGGTSTAQGGAAGSTNAGDVPSGVDASCGIARNDNGTVAGAVFAVALAWVTRRRKR
jgi:hypothetical protein